MWKVFAVIAAIVVAGCAWPKEKRDNPMPAQETTQHFRVKASGSQKLDYLLFLPADYSRKGSKTWPLMLFLHGAGERGTNVWKAATHGPPKQVKEHPDFPFIVVSPQCPEAQIWSIQPLLSLLDEVTKNYSVDKTRVYVTGLSMGGYGTWDL